MPTEPTESTEPSEHDARDLLARAAATIDVDEVAPLTLTGLPEPDGRRWPLLVAVAAAVVLVLGGGWWVATQVGTHGGTAAPADADGSPAETARVYDAGQMPSLLGYTEGEARTLLEDAGVDVRVRAERDGCNVAGTVVGADTPVGDRLRPGTTVTMFVVKPRKVTDCVGEPDWATIWDLVRFARGLGGPPVLAPEVELSLERPDLDPVAGATRTRDELADPDGWTICGADGMCHSPLAGLEQMLTDPAIWAYAGTPTLSVSQGPGCLVGHRGGWFSYDWTYHLSVEVPVDGISCPATSLLVGTDDQGRIDAVELRLPPQGADVSEPQLETTLSRLSAAAQLARWARGHGSAPHFADRVRDLTRGASQAWIDDPASLASWTCADCALGVFPIPADQKLVPSAGRSTCPDGGPVPSDYAGSADDVVTLGVPEPRTCDVGAALELWIDQDGRIYAVDAVATPY